MREGKSLSAQVLYGVIIFCVALTGFLAVLSVRPAQTDAAGNSSDLMCFPSLDYSCPCGPPCKKGGKPGGQGCPCFDITNGFTTPGKCIAPIKCQAQGQEGQPQIPMLPMIPPPMPPPPSTGDDPCMANSPIVTSSPNIASSTTSATSTDNRGCPSYGTDFSSSFPTYDYSSLYNTNTTGASGIGAIGGTGSTDGTSGAGGTGANTTSSTEPANVSSLLDGSINVGGTSGAGTNAVSGSGTTASGVAKPAFGSGDGVSGDARLQGNAMTLMVSNREAARGTQVSGMFGFTVASGLTATTVFKSMCAMRQWATSYLSLIIPSAYFDSLCTARGFALSAKLNSSTSGASGASASSPVLVPVTTGAGVQTGTGIQSSNSTVTPVATPPAPPAAPAYTGPQRADIWASPPTVAPGSRTSIFWEAKGVSSCAITSSDGGFSGSSLSGHGSTLPLAKTTTFSIECITMSGSSIKNQVVVTVK